MKIIATATTSNSPRYYLIGLGGLGGLGCLDDVKMIRIEAKEYEEKLTENPLSVCLLTLLVKISPQLKSSLTTSSM